MKKALLLCVVIVLALSFGCGQKEEVQENEVAVKEDVQKTAKELTPGETPSGAAKGGTTKKKTLIVDAVTGEKILSGELPYVYEYKGKTYFFKTEENMNLFKQDPLKYIEKPE
jgi:YHS domain-containing protein